MNINKDEIVDFCLKKWGPSDVRIDYFLLHYDNWIKQVPSECKETILLFLSEFEYYSHETTNKYLEVVHQKLIDDFNITVNNSIYLPILAKSGNKNSSIEYWNEYTKLNKINKHICFFDINSIDSVDLMNIENVILIDDCCGSGKTFNTFINDRFEMFVNKQIVYIVLHAMEEGKKSIQSYASQHNLKIAINCKFTQRKAFDIVCFPKKRDIVRQEFKNMSALLQIPSEHIFGYDESESLMAFYNNTPNNTLGIFRYNNEINDSIFPRENDERPTWQKMRKSTNDRKLRNYKNMLNGKKYG